MAMRGERLVSEKAKQQVKDVKWNCKKIRDSSDCHPVQLSMPIIGRILFSSQPHLLVLLLQSLMILDVNSPSKKEVFCDLWFKINPHCYLLFVIIQDQIRGKICNWIFVICNQGIIQLEDQTYWRLLHSIQIHLLKLSRKKPMTPVQNYLGFLNNSEKKAQSHRLIRWVQVYGKFRK